MVAFDGALIGMTRAGGAGNLGREQDAWCRFPREEQPIEKLDEERDLVAQFGDAYRRYRDQVGMLLPGRRS